MRLLGIGLVLLVVAACASSGQHVPIEKILAGKRFPSAASKAECLDAGGTWEDMSAAVASPPRTFIACIIPTEDAGKVCASSSDCEALCVLAKGQAASLGQPARGECMATYFFGGCHSYVHRGRVGTVFCSE
jgi:hypothetical protein